MTNLDVYGWLTLNMRDQLFEPRHPPVYIQVHERGTRGNWKSTGWIECTPLNDYFLGFAKNRTYKVSRQP